MGDMPSNTVSRRTKRMLRQCDRAENYASTNVFLTSDESHRVTSRNSKRWKAGIIPYMKRQFTVTLFTRGGRKVASVLTVRV
ncbi:hypothetical protein RchiOBHm_Chr2g0103941 [Rosa chinensis]|uniref:Uncharacterized protein n=1 Tax=Rosa chinensis TaxID=74649 RepID=A0A2P6RN45_ROSCH|nr:hypothetical protein RchiOBHm_Chr2g0103941 [Rosa chinensis]